MSRPLRLEYPGALYHLTSRGNARQEIFLDDTDRGLFLSTLSHVVSRYDWLCHAYCLMDNHYHLLIETPKPNLSLGMRQLNGVYTQAFNRSHRRVGHIFQGRYKAIIVEKEAHLLELCRYVVLNPLRVKSKRKVADWRWSSYRATAGIETPPESLTVDWVLGQFGRKRRQAQARYREFVREGLEHQPWERLKRQIYLGSEAFIERHTQGVEEIKEVPRVQWRAVRPTLEELFSRQGDKAVEVAYREYGYRLGEIAAYLGVHYATVSRRLKDLEGRKKRNV
ncbi:MAG: transposase [Deltaproteobacteria bacterium]|nr:transposase [Deltaproteobacteria bacterium]